jgi:5-methylcytosine-specific restriction endonuclease McrA
MANEREPISSHLRRQVLVGAGHRCAIPTCRSLSTEIHHIKPVKKGGKNRYSNLIALCPNCHARADKGEIDQKSLFTYKITYDMLLKNTLILR